LSPETLRVRIRQAEADDGSRRERLTSVERAVDEILRAARVSFARELDQPRTE